ncbi:hypothetical protein [Tomitella fengzijianii]|uniref:Uncharacterized protein n=1 Tax=Tomitella fengzijianii TaxID=2597660 RepID=A0A516X5W2_9ACTN|nr:hypothetical protein [Tomitella fengzijianii]QDQ98444.1 hypothetical protein FO059_15365 [Tomitella fengzijianii]
MKPSRLIARLLSPLAITLFLGGMYLGLSRPTLVQTPLGAVQCASAFGTGSVQGATETGQASCAALTSERQVWASAMLAISIGLLLGLVWVTATSISTDDGGGRTGAAPADGAWPPLDPSAGWADYPGQSPTTRAPQPPAPGSVPPPEHRPRERPQPPYAGPPED